MTARLWGDKARRAKNPSFSLESTVNSYAAMLYGGSSLRSE